MGWHHISAPHDTSCQSGASSAVVPLPSRPDTADSLTAAPMTWAGPMVAIMRAPAWCSPAGWAGTCSAGARCRTAPGPGAGSNSTTGAGLAATACEGQSGDGVAGVAWAPCRWRQCYSMQAARPPNHRRRQPHEVRRGGHLPPRLWGGHAGPLQLCVAAYPAGAPRGLRPTGLLASCAPRAWGGPRQGEPGLAHACRWSYQLVIYYHARNRAEGLLLLGAVASCGLPLCHQ